MTNKKEKLPEGAEFAIDGENGLSNAALLDEAIKGGSAPDEVIQESIDFAVKVLGWTKEEAEKMYRG